MSELKKHEIRSLEMQEVMSRLPTSFLKWSISLFFSFILVLSIGCFFLKNPEVISVPILITTQNPPVTLIAKTGGMIEKIFVNEDNMLEKDQIVAIISNTSDFSDIEKLTRFLSCFRDTSNWTNIVQVQSPPSNLILGEIQSDYSRFVKDWKQMRVYLEQDYISIKLALLQQQIQKKIEYSNELSIQKEFYIEEIMLVRNNLKKDSLLFNSFYKAVSEFEYDQSRQNYLQKLKSYSVFTATQISNESELLRMKELAFDLRIQYEKEITLYIHSLEESLQLLRSTINEWKEKYLIITPISGKISFTKFRHDNQVIKSGETLATIIPINSEDAIAVANIPSSGFGKIEIGQDVNIKLAGFPYIQYGVLKGRICSISQVPGADGFVAEIELINGMTSTYNEKIKFIYQMNGTAEIVTEESRQISKFINPIKSFFTN